MTIRSQMLGIDARPAPAETEVALHMDADEFALFYDRTARPVWAFLVHKTSDRNLADDLLQEAYYRFLRADRTFETEAHRRNYLYRVAANLANDALRRRRDRPQESLDAAPEREVSVPATDRTDLERAMSKLSGRQRDALWLAYGEGSTHEEIAGVLGVRTASVKVLLFRARRKLAGILTGGSR